MADTFNYRIDHHGSLVRPGTLLTARAEGEPETVLKAEREAVEEAVAFQRKVRSTVVTDGDFPREDFRSAVFDAVSGFRRTDTETSDGLPRWVAESLPEANGPLLADWGGRLAGLTVIAPKAALPSPAYLAATTFEPELAAAGGPSSARELGAALAEIIQAEIALLVARGVRLIQLNNPLLLGHVAADLAAPARCPSRTRWPWRLWRYGWTSARRVSGSASVRAGRRPPRWTGPGPSACTGDPCRPLDPAVRQGHRRRARPRQGPAGGPGRVPGRRGRHRVRTRGHRRGDGPHRRRSRGQGP